MLTRIGIFSRSLLCLLRRHPQWPPLPNLCLYGRFGLCLCLGSAESRNLRDQDLRKMAEWCQKEDAIICEKKSGFMNIGRASWPFYEDSMYINGVALPQVFEHKHLGFFINPRLSANVTLKKAIATASRKTYQVKRSFKTKSEKFTIKIWTNFVQPYLEFAAIMFDLRENLELQKKLCRVQKWFFHGTIFHEKGPAPALKRIRYLRLSFMHKLFHGKLGLDRDEILLFAESTTRLSNFRGILHPKTITSMGSRVFGSSIAAEWLAVPPAVRNCAGPTQFARYLKEKHPPTRHDHQPDASARFSWRPG